MINKEALVIKQIQELNQQTSISSSIQYVLKNQKTPYLYFEWMESTSALNLLYSKPTVPSTIIRLYESDAHFQMDHLSHPEKIQAVSEVVQKVFNQQKSYSYLLTVAGKPFGILFLSEKNEWMDHLLSCLQVKCESFVWKNQCTPLSYEEQFLKILFSEISRARRLTLPVSLILIECLGDKVPKHCLSVFLKSLYQHILKNIRMYDTAISLNEKELAILLPHTSLQAAQQKAEKIYWILDAIDSTKIFNQSQDKLQFKVAATEYPSVARDATHLLQVARQTCQYQKRKRSLCGRSFGWVSSRFLDSITLS